MNRRCLVFIVIAASACGGQSRPAPLPAAAPSPFVQNFAGVWQGTLRVTACGLDFCKPYGRDTYPFILRAAQAGNQVTGILTVTYMTRLDVTGTVAPGGDLTLTGARMPSTGDPSSSRLTQGTLRITSSGDLTGTLAVDTATGNPDARHGSGSITGDILTGTRAPSNAVLAEPSYSGHWNGRFIIDSCNWIGWNDCWPWRKADGFEPLDLTLQQVGTTVNGWFNQGADQIPVSGTVSAGVATLTLDGTLTRPVSGGSVMLRLTTLVATRDEVGHLQGGFHAVYEVHWNKPEQGLPFFSTTYDATISLLLLPN